MKLHRLSESVFVLALASSCSTSTSFSPIQPGTKQVSKGAEQAQQSVANADANSNSVTSGTEEGSVSGSDTQPDSSMPAPISGSMGSMGSQEPPGESLADSSNGMSQLSQPNNTAETGNGSVPSPMPNITAQNSDCGKPESSASGVSMAIAATTSVDSSGRPKKKSGHLKCDYKLAAAQVEAMQLGVTLGSSTSTDLNTGKEKVLFSMDEPYLNQVLQPQVADKPDASKFIYSNVLNEIDYVTRTMKDCIAQHERLGDLSEERMSVLKSQLKGYQNAKKTVKTKQAAVAMQ